MIRIEETDNRFYVKESGLPNAGLGLYAKYPLKKGGFLEIIGVMVQRHMVADACTAFANNYKFGTKTPDGEIWHIIPLGWGGMINQANSEEQQNCEIRNVRAKVPSKKIKGYKSYVSYSGEAVYFFTRDIAKDEELLGSYGHEWKQHKEWVQKYNKFYDDSNSDWAQFLSYGLYNTSYLKDRIPLEDNNVDVSERSNAGSAILTIGTLQ
jgi:hypothetical protein